MVGEDCRLNLAHQGLKTVPQTLINSFQHKIKILDLTNNQISELTYLILDHNLISDEVIFPVCPNVTVLWLNHNHIHNTETFIPKLRNAFPGLKELSLMGNPCAAPPIEDRFYEYLRYRLFILFWFQDLEYLDDRFVTEDEVKEAIRLFKKDLFEKLNALSIIDVLENAAHRLRRFVSLQSQTGRRPNLI